MSLLNASLWFGVVWSAQPSSIDQWQRGCQAYGPVVEGLSDARTVARDSALRSTCAYCNHPWFACITHIHSIHSTAQYTHTQRRYRLEAHRILMPLCAAMLPYVHVHVKRRVLYHALCMWVLSAVVGRLLFVARQPIERRAPTQVLFLFIKSLKKKKNEKSCISPY